MLKIKKVYVADNGDIFLIRETNYAEPTKEEVNDLKSEALEMLDRGEFETCIYMKGNMVFGSYYTLDGEFLGNELIHITVKYNRGQEGWYLNYGGY